MDSKNVLATKGSLGKNVPVGEQVIDNGEKAEILKTFFTSLFIGKSAPWLLRVLLQFGKEMATNRGEQQVRDCSARLIFLKICGGGWNSPEGAGAVTMRLLSVINQNSWQSGKQDCVPPPCICNGWLSQQGFALGCLRGSSTELI